MFIYTGRNKRLRLDGNRCVPVCTDKDGDSTCEMCYFPFPQPKRGKVNEIECRDNKELDEEGKGIETADNTTVLIEKLCRHLLLLFTSFVLYLTLHLTIFIGLAAAKSKLTHSSAF